MGGPPAVSATAARRATNVAQRLPAATNKSRRLIPLIPCRLLFLYQCALVKNDCPTRWSPPPDARPPRAARSLQQGVSQQIQIARQLAAVEIGRLPVVILDGLVLACLEGLEHVLPTVAPARRADLPEVGGDHGLDGHT